MVCRIRATGPDRTQETISHCEKQYVRLAQCSLGSKAHPLIHLEHATDIAKFGRRVALAAFGRRGGRDVLAAFRRRVFAVPGNIRERSERGRLDVLSLAAFGKGMGWISCPWQHLGRSARGGLDLLSLAAFGRRVGWICCPWQHLGEGWAQGPSERPLSRIRGPRAHWSHPSRGFLHPGPAGTTGALGIRKPS